MTRGVFAVLAAVLLLPVHCDTTYSSLLSDTVTHDESDTSGPDNQSPSFVFASSHLSDPAIRAKEDLAASEIVRSAKKMIDNDIAMLGIAAYGMLMKEKSPEARVYAGMIEEAGLAGVPLLQAEQAALESYTYAAEAGLPLGHAMLGFLLLRRTNYSDPVSSNLALARAHLHLEFGARGGNNLAQMALGFRYLYGIGVEKSCPAALSYYSRAARDVVKHEMGTELPIPMVDAIRLVPEKSDGVGTREDEDAIHFYEYSASNGNSEAQFTIGYLSYFGARGAKQDAAAAIKWLTLAAQQNHAHALAMLGIIYLRGSGVPKDYAKAHDYFSRASTLGQRSGRNGLGILYMHGLHVAKDADRAMALFKQAATDGLPDGQFNYATMFITGTHTPRDYTKALSLFAIAGQGGHLFAKYNAAIMYANGMGTPASCGTAVALMKQVAEKGRDIFLQGLMRAQELYLAGHDIAAFSYYMRAALAGIEIAQSNAAFMLRQESSIVARYTAQPIHLQIKCFLWSCHQGHVQSLIYLADQYYYGGKGGIKKNLKRAANLYLKAGESRSAEGYFNLGMLHLFTPFLLDSSPMFKVLWRILAPGTTRAAAAAAAATTVPGSSSPSSYSPQAAAGKHHGSGPASASSSSLYDNEVDGFIKQDFHLSKRYFDLALEHDKKAYLGVTIMLYVLNVFKWFAEHPEWDIIALRILSVSTALLGIIRLARLRNW